MGCCQSVTSASYSGKDSIEVTHSTVTENSEFITPSIKNSKTSSQKSLKTKRSSSITKPSSQSYELASKPINASMSSSEDDAILDYITATVNWRNQHGGGMALETQLKKQRCELICIGAFIVANNQLKQFKIISIDKKLPDTDAPYRPDLIAQSIETNRIIHVEIDEYGHRRYDQKSEQLRSAFIEDYFSDYAYSCVHFHPNRYRTKLEMANAFVHLMQGIDGLICAHGHN